MKKNDLMEVNIEYMLFPNKGVGMWEDKKVIVKNALPGQKILAKVKKNKQSGIEGVLEKVLEKASEEGYRSCSHFPVCGGCVYQGMEPSYENKWKEYQVLDILRKAGIENFDYEGIVLPSALTGYRNKCEFSFGDAWKDGPLALGMRKRQSRYEVVTLRDCNIVDEDYIHILQTVLSFFQECQEPFYHKMRHEGVLRYLVVRKAAYTGEILVNLVTTSQYSFSQEALTQTLLSCSLEGNIVGILHTIHDGVADVVKSDSTAILYGRDFFIEKLFDLQFRVSAFSFFQTNTKGAEELYGIVQDFAGDSKDKILFDLYCGTGTIGQIMAKQCKKVYGIEIVEEAVEAANENARLNGLENCQFLAGDVLKKIEELEEKPDIMILDPPRDGIHPKALPKIIGFQAPEIVYISCKPTSMAKDLPVFLESGYAVKRVKIVNQFFRTGNVETVVLLTKRS